MNLSTKFETDFAENLAVPSLPACRPWDERLASLISDLFSPPWLAVAGLVLATRLFNYPGDYLWVVYYLALVVGVPVIYLVWKVHQGAITDFHMRIREQRLRPMLLTLACALAGLASLWAGQAPRVLLIMSGMGVIQVGLLLLVTLRWKISGHGAAIGSLATFAWSIYGSPAAPVLLAIPLVAWARVRLNRHTPAQTLAGSLVGIGVMLLLLQLI